MAIEIVNKGVWVGYDGHANAQRTEKDQTFQTWFQAPELRTELRDASIRAAKQIRDSTDKEIVVLYSGGMDSEWILESFVLAGIPVTPLVVVYEDGLNKHDVDWATRYIQRRKIEGAVYDTLNLRDWYKSQGQKDIAWITQTPELAYTSQFQAIQKLNDGNRFFITGYDEPGMVADDSGAQRAWRLFYNERHYSVVKMFSQFGVPGVPNWGRYSNELFASYVCQPQWQMLVANMFNPMIWNAEMIKVQMFQASFPFMEARPKFTGFETSLDFIVESSRTWQASVVERLGYKWTQEWSDDIKNVWSVLGLKDRP